MSVTSGDVQISFKSPSDTGPGYYIDSITPGEPTGTEGSGADSAETDKGMLDHLLTETADIPFSLQKGIIIQGAFEGETTGSAIVAFDGEVSGPLSSMLAIGEYILQS